MSTSFSDLGVPARLVTRLPQQGIFSPFPIQAATIPDALAGRDVCGRAPTGSGKTIAFGIAVVPRPPDRRPDDPGRWCSFPPANWRPRSKERSRCLPATTEIGSFPSMGAPVTAPPGEPWIKASTSSLPAPDA